MIYHFLVVKCRPWQIFRLLFHAAKTFSETWNIRLEIWLKMQKTSQRHETSNAKTATIRISHARSHWYLNISEKNKTLGDVFLSNGLIDIDFHRFPAPLCRQKKCWLPPPSLCPTNEEYSDLKALFPKMFLGCADAQKAENRSAFMQT